MSMKMFRSLEFHGTSEQPPPPLPFATHHFRVQEGDGGKHADRHVLLRRMPTITQDAVLSARAGTGGRLEGGYSNAVLASGACRLALSVLVEVERW
jgi:hypothetical protein